MKYYCNCDMSMRRIKVLPRRVVVSRLLTQLLNYAYYYEEVD